MDPYESILTAEPVITWELFLRPKRRENSSVVCRKVARPEVTYQP